MTTIKMPQLGETLIEGTILRWLKAEGDTVVLDEPLFEISTDKVDTEVPASVAGTLTRILVPEGTTVKVGTDVAEITEAGQAAAPVAPAAAAPAAPAAAPVTTPTTTPAAAAPVAAPVAAPAAPVSQVAPPTQPVATGPRAGILSPLVRKLAADNGVDLDRIAGTGAGGRITKRDVLAAIAAPAAAVSTAAPAAPAAPAASQPAAVAAPIVPAATPAVAAPPPSIVQGEERIPVTHIRRAIANHMQNSVNQTARAWTLVEVNVERLVQLRARMKEPFKQRYGVNLTYLPFVVRATTEALLEFPMVNARLDGDQIVLHRFVNMGIAVSYDAGLIVPVVRAAESLNTVGIARSIADLAARARSHDLRPDEVQGSTFTITNPGPYGSTMSVPIINTPNVGILSLDGIVKRPVVVDDALAIRSMVNISMSWDHRVIDGEQATRFLARVRQNLETWDFSEDLGL